MAIVRVDFGRGKLENFAPAIAALVNASMEQILNIPAQENYVLCSAHIKEMLLHHPRAVPKAQLGEIVFVQITLSQKRTPELKAKFFSHLTRELCAVIPLCPEHVFINLIEVNRENWSFGQPAVYDYVDENLVPSWEN